MIIIQIQEKTTNIFLFRYLRYHTYVFVHNTHVFFSLFLHMFKSNLIKILIMAINCIFCLNFMSSLSYFFSTSKFKMVDL